MQHTDSRTVPPTHLGNAQQSRQQDTKTDYVQHRPECQESSLPAFFFFCNDGCCLASAQSSSNIPMITKYASNDYPIIFPDSVNVKSHNPM